MSLTVEGLPAVFDATEGANGPRPPKAMSPAANPPAAMAA